MTGAFRWLRGFWPPGVRAQLTLGYAVVFGFVLLVGGIITIALVGQSIAGRYYSNLDTRANQLAANIAHANNCIVIQDPNRRLPVFPVTQWYGDVSASKPCAQHTTAPSSPGAGANVATDPLVRVANLDGATVYESPAFAALDPMPKASVADPLNGQTWRNVVTTGDRQSVAMLSVAILDNHHQIFAIIQIGQPIGGLQDLQRNLRVIALGVALTLLLVSVGASFALATRAFRPVRRLTQAANAIKGGDLRQRVPLPAARDDIRSLAVTFNAMIAQLEQSFTQQRRFVADASHELRTPVAVIRSVTDVALAQDTSREEYAAVLREVNAEAERLGKLINTLLALARSDEGQFALETELVRLDLLAADAAASAQALAEEHGLRLETGALDPITVRGDTARLIQIIMSLLDNAITYTPAGGSVTVSVTATADHALLAVTDTGIGISQDDLPHIFERFYRADPARTRAQGGSGLGLALAQEIARAHGGAVTASSAPGIGSTFTVTLPRWRET